jgi:hypothetical protein
VSSPLLAVSIKGAVNLSMVCADSWVPKLELAKNIKLKKPDCLRVLNERRQFFIYVWFDKKEIFFILFFCDFKSKDTNVQYLTK